MKYFKGIVMFVELRDIKFSMNWSSTSYLNIFTGEIKERYELSEEEFNDCIEIPLANIREIKERFIDSINHKPFKNKFRNIQDEEFESVFHRQINEFTLCDEWYDYESQELGKLAEEWCNKNNIKYSNKQNKYDEDVNITSNTM